MNSSALWSDLRTFDRLCLYSLDASCEYPSSALYTLLANVLKVAGKRAQVITPDTSRIFETSRRCGWDARQLQALRKLKLSTNLGELDPSYDIVVYESVDLLAVIFGKEKVFETLSGCKRWICTFSGRDRLNYWILHQTDLRVELGYLGTGISRDVHGYLGIEPQGQSNLIRFTDTDMQLLKKQQ